MSEENPPIGESIGWKSKEISTLSQVSSEDVKKAKALVEEESPKLSEILDAK